MVTHCVVPLEPLPARLAVVRQVIFKLRAAALPTLHGALGPTGSRAAQDAFVWRSPALHVHSATNRWTPEGWQLSFEALPFSMLMLLLAVRLRREKPHSAFSIYLVRIEGSSPSRICTTCGSLTARAAMPGATATRLFHRAALIPWPLSRMVGMRYALCCIFVPLCCAVCVACCEVQWMALTRATVTIVYILPSSV